MKTRRSLTTVRRLPVVLLVGALAAAGLGAPLAGCDGRAASADAGTPVDAPLMAFLSAARALHHEASLREAESDRKGAIAALERLTVLARPAGGPPEVAEILADTLARLAELRAAEGDLAGADKDIAAGLALAPKRSYFEGHLYEVGGVVEEARAKVHAAAGAEGAAREARGRAVELLRKAVAVQEDVIRSALNKDAGAR